MDSFVSTLTNSFFNLSSLWVPVLSVISIVAIGITFTMGLRLINYFIKDMRFRSLGGDYQVYKKGKRIY